MPGAPLKPEQQEVPDAEAGDRDDDRPLVETEVCDVTLGAARVQVLKRLTPPGTANNTRLLTISS